LVAICEKALRKPVGPWETGGSYEVLLEVYTDDNNKKMPKQFFFFIEKAHSLITYDLACFKPDF